MKRFGLFITACALTSLTACSSAPKPTTEQVSKPDTSAVASIKDSLKTQVERYSYALGMDVGKTLKSILVDVNMDAFNLAMTHQMSGKASLLTDEEAETALETLLLQVQEKRDQTAKEEAQKEKIRQTEFLAKNKLDSTVIVTASGLQYKIIKDGQGLSPKRTEKVKVHYIGSLLDGKEFDNSIKRGEPLTFDVAHVIEGWQELLTLMKPGMKVKAWIPSALGYGEEGAEPIIPRNALLVFEVELLEVFAEPSPQEVIAPVDSLAKPEVKTEAQPAAKAEAKPEVKTEAKPAAKAEAKPEVKTEAKPAAKAEAKPEVKTEAKPAAKAEAKPAAKTEAKPAAKAEAKPAAKTDKK
jgi:FKBP-type peptidyl-prolyl cis-trans isomerase